MTTKFPHQNSEYSKTPQGSDLFVKIFFFLRDMASLVAYILYEICFTYLL